MWRSWQGPKLVSKRSEARFPPCPAQIGPRFPDGGFAGNRCSVSSPVSWKLGANFQKNGGRLWCAQQLFYGFNFVSAGRKRKYKKCRSLLLPCSWITGLNCGCFWFLGFFLREGWWTKKDVKNFCSRKILMQVQSHVRLHPQIFCGYTTCCDAWGPGRRLTGASLLKYIVTICFLKMCLGIVRDVCCGELLPQQLRIKRIKCFCGSIPQRKVEVGVHIFAFLPRFWKEILSTRWFKVPFSSPSWRSLNPLKILKGSLNHPKKVTLNHQESLKC